MYFLVNLLNAHNKRKLFKFSVSSNQLTDFCRQFELRIILEEFLVAFAQSNFWLDFCLFGFSNFSQKKSNFLNFFKNALLEYHHHYPRAPSNDPNPDVFGSILSGFVCLNWTNVENNSQLGPFLKIKTNLNFKFYLRYQRRNFCLIIDKILHGTDP